MGHDGVLAVDYGRVVTALIKHSHIDAENVGEINGTVHCSFVRAYHHQALLIDDQFRLCPKKGFHELVRRIEVVETVQRNRILDSRVMGIEGKNIGDAHVDQFLKRQGAVQGFALRTLVLAALIQERHDDIDTVSLAVGR